jgi:phage terminase large subunit-like protein
VTAISTSSHADGDAAETVCTAGLSSTTFLAVIRHYARHIRRKKKTGGDVSNSVRAGHNYAEQVAGGKVLTGKLVKLACERHLRDLEHGKERGLSFDEANAARVIRFFTTLKHSKGEWGGHRFVVEPWQCFILSSLFGWKRERDNLRRFREGYIEVARKNGKSTLFAGTGLYLVVGDNEPGAEVYTFATTKEQARDGLFEEAVRMRNASPSLSKRTKKYVNNINAPASASKFMPLASDSKRLDGLNAHGGLADELHEHPDRSLWDVIDTSTAARRQPLMLAITTAGFDRQSFCYTQHEYAVKVLTGALEDDTFFAFIAALDDGDAWQDEKNWYKANPNLGVSVKLDDLQRKAKRAAEEPTALSNFQRKHLNLWVSADHAWMNMDKWRKCADPSLKLADFAAQDCVLGVDLAAKLDLLAKMRVFSRLLGNPITKRDEWHYYVFGNYWTPRETLNKSKLAHYRLWADKDILSICEGATNDYNAVEDAIREDARTYQVLEVAHDPYQAVELVNHLQQDGIEMTEVPQLPKYLSEPMKELEAAVYDGRFHFDGDPLLTWSVSNVVCHLDKNDNYFPNKERYENKIDPITALLTALHRVMMRHAQTADSDFEVIAVL